MLSIPSARDTYLHSAYAATVARRLLFRWQQRSGLSCTVDVLGQNEKFARKMVPSLTFACVPVGVPLTTRDYAFSREQSRNARTFPQQHTLLVNISLLLSRSNGSIVYPRCISEFGGLEIARPSRHCQCCAAWYMAKQRTQKEKCF